MAWNVGTSVQVELILGQQIDVVKHETVEGALQIEHILKRCVVQQSFVKRT